MQARIRKLLPAPAAQATPAGTALRVEATITRDASGGFQLKLVIRAGDLVGERTIAGRSCEDLAGATAVNLALLLGARGPLSAADIGAPPAASTHAGDEASGPGAAGSTTPEPGTAPAAPPAAPPSAERQASPEAQPRQAASPEPPAEVDAPSPRTWRGLLGVPLAALELGPLPSPSLGGAVAAGVWFDRWRILAEGSLWLRQRLSVTAPHPASADVDRVAATLRTCRTFPFGRFELAPCVHVSLRHVTARGAGPQVAARTEASMWVAPGVGAQGRLLLAPWLGVIVSVDAAIEGARPRIAIDGVGRVGQLGPAAVKLALGLEWIL